MNERICLIELYTGEACNIPVRFIYPATEQSINGANYQAVVASQGAGALTTKLWFDVN
ncbi:hypothetical protein [Mucilaginibacter glaciei]|uniref:Uncharacterized protein n=1 Tax=Mucilaginibacter glaciei TaxID=2772109 RepID=A0A926RZ84_9SPHI|nr:hypothetical protein [Mucilaginibacter glaciei]MBD1391600.1 hypothetical protein [Mucilaginibacter glaciei]